MMSEHKAYAGLYTSELYYLILIFSKIFKSHHRDYMPKAYIFQT